MRKFVNNSLNYRFYTRSTQQKFKQTIFEKLNLVKDGDFHEAEAVAYVENHLKDDAEWQDVLKKAVPECHKGVDPHMGGLQESTNFTKQECNMKFHILTHCMDIFGFTVSIINKTK